MCLNEFERIDKQLNTISLLRDGFRFYGKGKFYARTCGLFPNAIRGRSGFVLQKLNDEYCSLLLPAEQTY